MVGRSFGLAILILLFNVRTIARFCFRQRPKTGIPGPFGAKNRYILKTKSKEHPTSPAIGPKRIVPVLGRIKPRYTRGFLLRLTSSCFCHFFSRSPPCECRRTGSPPPPSTSHTPHHTSNTCICLHTAAEIHRHEIRIQFAPWPQTAVRQLHPKSRNAPSILRCWRFARPPRSRQIRVLLVWRGVRCGGWEGLPVRRHSYRGHNRVELWRLADWLKNDNNG